MSADQDKVLQEAIEDIGAHFSAWTTLLEAYVEMLPPGSVASESDAARSYAEHELRAMYRDIGALLSINRHRTARTPGWISASCRGETCSVCFEAACAKVEEVIFDDDPAAIRHPLSAYLCESHFRWIIGEPGCEWLNLVRQRRMALRTPD